MRFGAVRSEKYPSYSAAMPEKMPRGNAEGKWAEAYDERRSWRARNATAAAQVTPDHVPTCPRCYDLLPVGSTYCAECGTRVTVDKPGESVEGSPA